jgi:hypothetical protein
MPNTWPAWKTCSISINPIRSARWSASTKAQPKLIGEVLRPIPAKPGQIERYDCEYKTDFFPGTFLFSQVV